MSSSSSNKSLAVVVGFTLALMLVVSNGEETSSYGGSAVCDSSPGVACTSDADCVPICKQKAGQNYVYAYCSAAAEPPNGRSCVCTQRCAAPPAQSTPAPLEKPAATPTPAGSGTGMLN